jgi:hypothetical protein
VFVNTDVDKNLLCHAAASFTDEEVACLHFHFRFYFSIVRKNERTNEPILHSFFDKQGDKKGEAPCLQFETKTSE